MELPCERSLDRALEGRPSGLSRLPIGLAPPARILASGALDLGAREGPVRRDDGDTRIRVSPEGLDRAHGDLRADPAGITERNGDVGAEHYMRMSM
jgi:hypothetical protein